MGASCVAESASNAPIAGTQSNHLSKWCPTGASITKVQVPTIKRFTSMTIKLDQARADMMQALYEASGRTNGLYTGLWREFATDLAQNFRDQDYDDLVQQVASAIDETDSHLAERHAIAAIAVCRKALLGKWFHDRT